MLDGLSGCDKPAQSRGPSNNPPSTASVGTTQPSPSDMADLILGYEHLHCVSNNYEYPWASYEPLRQFFGAQIRAGFLTAGQSSGALTNLQGWSQTFPYRDRFNIGQAAQLWAIPGEVRVGDCGYVPTGIQILDTTYDATGKQAQVIFRNSTAALTDFAERLVSAMGPLPSQRMQISGSPGATAVEIDNVELVAQLQKLDATGWRVNDIQASGR